MPDATPTETPVAALAQVAWWPGRGDAVAEALRAAGLPAPPMPGRAARAGEVVALDAGPGRAALLGPSGTVEAVIAAVSSEDGTVTDLSAGRVRLTLDGPRARWVLSKGTAVDLRDGAFPPDAVAMTALHGIPVTLWRDGDAVAILAPASYAASLRGWLVEAMRPDGVVT